MKNTLHNKNVNEVGEKERIKKCTTHKIRPNNIRGLFRSSASALFACAVKLSSLGPRPRMAPRRHNLTTKQEYVNAKDGQTF